MINRTKEKNRPNYPKEPENLDEVNFPEFLTKIKDENFLFYDSGVDDPCRFIIFTTMNNLKLLEQYHIFCDGTFDIAPKPSYQVYSIHCLVENQCLPMTLTR